MTYDDHHTAEIFAGENDDNGPHRDTDHRLQTKHVAPSLAQGGAAVSSHNCVHSNSHVREGNHEGFLRASHHPCNKDSFLSRPLHV